MGYITELRFTAKLKKDIPVMTVDLFTRLYVDHTWGLDEEGSEMRPRIDHPFFDCERWLLLLTSTGDLLERYTNTFQREADGAWTLDINTAFKNYDDEVRYFLDWISPYVIVGKEGALLGWYQGETDEEKTMIMLSGDQNGAILL